MSITTTMCAVTWCSKTIRPSGAKGFCQTHYKQLRRGLNPHSQPDKPKFKHGYSKTVEYKTWKNMVARCYNINHRAYSRYGGRGITVCERWRNSFGNFLLDMGKRPSDKMSIDRIDNNKGYCKENCRWATLLEQNLNRRIPNGKPERLKFIYPNSGRWRVQFSISHDNYKEILYIGNYVDIEEAIAIRDSVIEQLY